ncbi:GNAT family N-acetyltransferase [Caulobacter flavus]|uniref:GNAT family N-acetyltransferase n=1 Tax=Caulobacter flavus TaxID=1679497 RepID=A0A2N5CLE9_9CAUL|nr:GNAT family N-acetyltransferase [Caulobacter flavus]AYV48380.1 GNAT family N-acetyltransferase [Caulobacter flavus]PLR06540.1 GNAT family N-acetyltransferase [Caulobacter flavus]
MEAATVVIRPYRTDDAPHMAQLYYDAVHGLGRREYSAAQTAAWAPAPLQPIDVLTRAADGRTTFVAADAEDRAVAYVDLEADGHVDHLYCHPDFAGQGVASRLLETVIQHAAEQGIAALYVEASELARPVFERHGFAVTARRDFEVRGVPIHNYAMRRDLA